MSLRAAVRTTAAILRKARPDVVLGMMHYSAALVTFADRQIENPQDRRVISRSYL